MWIAHKSRIWLRERTAWGCWGKLGRVSSGWQHGIGLSISTHNEVRYVQPKHLNVHCFSGRASRHCDDWGGFHPV